MRRNILQNNQDKTQTRLKQLELAVRMLQDASGLKANILPLTA
jgi:hypothetical protein